MHTRIEPRTPEVVCRMRGRIDPGDVARVCEGLRVVLEAGERRPIVCDVSDVVHPDAVAVEAVARLQLVARRMGTEVRLRDPGRDLLGLLELMGLRQCVPIVTS